MLVSDRIQTEKGVLISEGFELDSDHFLWSV